MSSLHTMGARELVHNLKNVTQKVQQGQSFIVLKHRVPLFKIVPIQESPEKKFSLKNLSEITFSSSDPELSTQVDNIVYQ